MQFLAVALSLAALATRAAASNPTILAPGGPNVWWVDQSDNVMKWTCGSSNPQQYTVFLANSNPNVLASALAIYSQQNDFDCSKLVTKDTFSLPPATGYTLIFADPLNPATVYATSQPFEIKALGSPYPASTDTPTGAPTSTPGGANSTASTTSGGTSPTGGAVNSTTPDGAAGVAVPVTWLTGALAVLGGMLI